MSDLYEVPILHKEGHCPTCGVKLDAKCDNDRCLTIHGSRSNPSQLECDYCQSKPQPLDFSEITRVM